ncbi:dTMP kinase [Acholeplasma morum]|uniref:dTMP kinase n=1 Tax=Paracholeplasma morum TaxID=264637 RepID=UPI0019562811|nr:dTMP kinase [Paracholeplasma morum]MBM7452908.1 dTMP kinase [Paracholeplasma morum]
MFITFEGGEGSGKTTLIQALKGFFETKNIEVVITREPGGSIIAEKIRQIILDIDNKGIKAKTEALLFAASRVQHLEEVIIPALNDNKVVLCDRFIDSSLAYQGYARGLGVEEVLKINTFALDYMPDITFYIDQAPEVGMARIQSRVNNRLDLEQLDFHHKVREGYLALSKRYDKRYIIINGDQSIEGLINDVKAHLKDVHLWKK